jgi:hypothetical protein
VERHLYVFSPRLGDGDNTLSSRGGILSRFDMARRTG